MPSRCAVNLWTVGCADPYLTARARSATAHKLHSTQQQHRMNLISGNDQTSSRLPVFSLSLPGTCPNNRDRRTVYDSTNADLDSGKLKDAALQASRLLKTGAVFTSRYDSDNYEFIAFLATAA